MLCVSCNWFFGVVCGNGMRYGRISEGEEEGAGMEWLK